MRDFLLDTVPFWSLLLALLMVLTFSAQETTQAQEFDPGDVCSLFIQQPPEQQAAAAILIAYGYDYGYAVSRIDVSLPLIDFADYDVGQVAVRMLEKCYDNPELRLYQAVQQAYHELVVVNDGRG